MTTPVILLIRPTGKAADELAAYSGLLQKVFGAGQKFSPKPWPGAIATISTGRC